MQTKLLLLLLAFFILPSCKMMSSSSYLSYVQACGDLCNTFKNHPPEKKAESLMVQVQSTFGPYISYYYASVVAHQLNISIPDAFTALGNNSEKVLENLERGTTVNGQRISLTTIQDYYRQVFQEGMRSNPEYMDDQLERNMFLPMEDIHLMMNTTEVRVPEWTQAAFEYTRMTSAASDAYFSLDRATQQKVPNALVLAQHSLVLRVGSSTNESNLATEVNRVTTQIWNTAGHVLNAQNVTESNRVRGDLLRLTTTGELISELKGNANVSRIFANATQSLIQGDVGISSSLKASIAATFGEFAVDTTECSKSINTLKTVAVNYGAKASSFTALSQYTTPLNSLTVEAANRTTLTQSFRGMSNAINSAAALRATTMRYLERAYTLPKYQAKARMMIR